MQEHRVTIQGRTYDLVMVFGDHGFMLDDLEGGTTAARHGGSRPEEVLVPGFAWLIGGLH
jgi:hypothetical protein